MLPLQIIRQVYYAVKEALYNVERHSRARCVHVALDWGADDLTIQIQDDGVGFDPKMIQKDRHFGLDIMRKRIESCKGRLTFISEPGAGTTVIMWLPTNFDEALNPESRQN